MANHKWMDRLKRFVMSKFVFLFVAVLFLQSPLLEAKELSRRLGVGVRTHPHIEVPELVASYFPNSDYAYVAGLGIDTQQDSAKFTLNASLRRIVFKEPNMNFYMGGRLGLINYEVAADKKSGFEVSGLFGGEFFLNGLDSLGFTFEGGIAVVSTNKVRFTTVAQSPLTAGVIFYF